MLAKRMVQLARAVIWEHDNGLVDHGATAYQLAHAILEQVRREDEERRNTTARIVTGGEA